MIKSKTKIREECMLKKIMIRVDVNTYIKCFIIQSNEISGL